MKLPRLVHLWIVGRRSLCDNKAYPGAHQAWIPRSQEAMDEDFNAPMCAACLVIVRQLAAMADEILASRGTVYPTTVREALQSLPESWDKEWDLAEMVSRPPFANSSVMAFWDVDTGLAANSYMVSEIIPNTDERERAERAARDRESRQTDE